MHYYFSIFIHVQHITVAKFLIEIVKFYVKSAVVCGRWLGLDLLPA